MLRRQPMRIDRASLPDTGGERGEGAAVAGLDQRPAPIAREVQGEPLPEDLAGAPILPSQHDPHPLQAFAGLRGLQRGEEQLAARRERSERVVAVSPREEDLGRGGRGPIGDLVPEQEAPDQDSAIVSDVLEEDVPQGPVELPGRSPEGDGANRVLPHRAGSEPDLAPVRRPGQTRAGRPRLRQGAGVALQVDHHLPHVVVDHRMVQEGEPISFRREPEMRDPPFGPEQRVTPRKLHDEARARPRARRSRAPRRDWDGSANRRAASCSNRRTSSGSADRSSFTNLRRCPARAGCRAPGTPRPCLRPRPRRSPRRVPP